MLDGRASRVHREPMWGSIVGFELLAEQATGQIAQAPEKVASSGWEAIVEHNGIGISITGMAIVFAALVIISLMIALVPRVLAWLDPILPKGHSHATPPSRSEQTPIDREKVVAAIGIVLHTELQNVMQNSK